MDQDDKTAREHPGGPVVRSTAPAGTPYPVAPDPMPVVPVPAGSQPRTVGGHTARLLIPEDEAVSFDSLDSGLSFPLPVEPPPSSQTVGGTMRLAAVAPDEAAAAQHELAQREPAPRPPARDGASPLAPSPAAPKPAAAPPVAPAVVLTALDDDEPSTLSLLFAPLSVTVGIVSFAMGCMLELTIDSRLHGSAIRAQTAAPSASAAPTAPASPPAVTTPPVPSPSAAASLAPVGVPPGAASAATSVVPAASVVPAGKPPAPSGPAVRPQGKGGRPPLPFP